MIVQSLSIDSWLHGKITAESIASFMRHPEAWLRLVNKIVCQVAKNPQWIHYFPVKLFCEFTRDALVSTRWLCHAWTSRLRSLELFLLFSLSRGATFSFSLPIFTKSKDKFQISLLENFAGLKRWSKTLVRTYNGLANFFWNTKKLWLWINLKKKWS